MLEQGLGINFEGDSIILDASEGKRINDDLNLGHSLVQTGKNESPGLIPCPRLFQESFQDIFTSNVEITWDVLFSVKILRPENLRKATSSFLPLHFKIFKSTFSALFTMVMALQWLTHQNHIKTLPRMAKATKYLNKVT